MSLDVVFEHERVVLFHGDASLLELPPNSVDAIVSDPPAGVSFMDKDWDDDKGGRDAWIAWLIGVLKPAYDALKPGGHGLIWALPRTSHWTATALENLGFEIRDIVMHIFGTGFPKSLTSKSAPIPEGTGSALKPAAEHWILVRKPLEGTYGANFAKYGTGVLQIDATRIETEDKWDPSTRAPNESIGTFQTKERTTEQHELGRWPAHVTLDEDAAEVLDAQSGMLKSGSGAVKRSTGAGHTSNSIGTESRPTGTKMVAHTSSLVGGASRFFYVAKGSRSEKDAGLEHLPVKSGGEATGREDGSAGVNNPRAGAGRTGGARNFHPTVKSIALMRWLCRLITPPGGVVLDPFAGSGSTGVAALAEGMSFIGVELTDEYLPILRGRIEHALKSDAKATG